MAKEARHHHYIPQAYLRGFGNKRTSGRKTNWYTYVSDLREKRFYETNVRNVCGERDFMRYEMEGESPTRLEHELGQFEGKACESIRRVVETGTFDGEDKIQVLNLMAILAVRSPEQRENIRDFHERVSKRVLSMALSTKERWEGQMRQLTEATGKAYESSYEEVKAHHESGAYRVEVIRERLIGLELSVFETVLNCMSDRKWTLYTADGQHGHFITTNCPVVLSFVDERQYRQPPGHGLKGTEVFFPLTKNGFLIGRWDRGDHTEVAQQGFIGAVNQHMIEESYGQVFSNKKSVVYFDPLMNLRSDEKLMERFTTEPTAAEIAAFRAKFPDLERPEGS
jgi:hypothetical protein